MSQTPDARKNASESVDWPVAVPSTSGMKDVVKNLTVEEDKPRKAEPKEFQKLTSNKMRFHSMDDSTIQFDMVMVITDMSKPTVLAIAKRLRVMRHCNVKPTMQTMCQMSRSSGEPEFYVFNLGCAGESLVLNCWSVMQLEHSALTGRPEIESEEQRRGLERGKIYTWRHEHENALYL